MSKAKKKKKPAKTSTGTTKASVDASLSDSGLSARTLEDTPGRAVTFLRGVGTTPAIRIGMRARGYSAADHSEGWRLVQAASGFTGDDEQEVRTDRVVTEAIAALNANDEDLFRIIRSASRKHPAAVAFIVAGLAPVDGPEAALGVETLLERLNALQSGAERKATRKDDAKALATLAERGLHKTERARLAALVATAKTLRDDRTPDDDAEAAATAAYIGALDELRGWFEEWTQVARAAIKRRDHLIRLGLAERRPPTKNEEPSDPTL